MIKKLFLEQKNIRNIKSYPIERDGTQKFEINNKRWGLVDSKSGNVLLSFIYGSITNVFPDGMRELIIKGKYGLAESKTGKVILPCIYYSVHKHKDGWHVFMDIDGVRREGILQKNKKTIKWMKK